MLPLGEASNFPKGGSQISQKNAILGLSHTFEAIWGLWSLVVMKGTHGFSFPLCNGFCPFVSNNNSNNKLGFWHLLCSGCARFSQLTIYFYFFYQKCSKPPDSRLALVGRQPNRVRLKYIYFHLLKPILAKWSQKWVPLMLHGKWKIWTKHTHTHTIKRKRESLS